MPKIESKHSSKKWRVFLSRDTSGLKAIEPMMMVIAPANDNWNDFGKKTLAVFRALNSASEEYKGRIFVGVMGDVAFEKSNASMLSRTLFDGDRAEITDAHKVFSMLPDMQAYRDLVAYAGKDGARQILKASRDLVLAADQIPQPLWSKKAKATETFALSFMRTSESFFAYHNAGSVLKGLQHEELGRVSKNLSLRFRLDAFTNPHAIDFTFDPASPLPKRIAVLIGKNGVGKSQSLNRLVRFSLEGHFEAPAQDDQQPKALFDSELGRPQISRIVAIATPGETGVTFPTRPRSQRFTEYRRLTLGRGAGKGQGGGLAGMLVQLVRNHEFIKDTRRWDIFLRAIASVLPIGDIALHATRIEKVQRPDSRPAREQYLLRLPSLVVRGGEQRQLETWSQIDESADPVRIGSRGIHTLSSGQLAFLRFAVQACLHIENGTLVLIDEPETHLHPNLISAFVDLLDRMLELTGSIAIVATHSAYLVREVPRSQVHILRDGEDGRIEIARPRLKTFGADVSTISMFVFEDDISNRLIEKVKAAIPNQRKRRKAFVEELRDDLSDEARMEIDEAIRA